MDKTNEQNNKYDYLIVGAGLFGAVCAWRLKQLNKKVLVIDKESRIGGNCYTHFVDGIHVHMCGPHIFHTDKKEIWEFANKFDEFEQYRYEPIANYNDEIYNLPFNLHTFNQLYGIKNRSELIKYKTKWEKKSTILDTVESYAINTIGSKGYKKLVKDYTEKQWNKSCKELPAWVLGRLPIRSTWDNNYFNDEYQGIPKNGYTKWIENMLNGVEVKLDTSFNINKHYDIADKIIYCGSVDDLFNNDFGYLEYRAMQYFTYYNEPSQGTAVINYTSHKVPYTRCIDHKMFLKSSRELPTTILSYEYPIQWSIGHGNRCYPIPTAENLDLYNKYIKLVKKTYPKIILGGRLGYYRYLNMDEIIENALSLEL